MISLKEKIVGACRGGASEANMKYAETQKQREGEVMGAVYYNDNDKHCCDWLRNLIDADLISDGYVDERGIEDVRSLEEFDRVHLFAGIGGWEYALDLACWPSNLKVMTGSCPCQPFSIAGRQKGVKDERHLWPKMLRLIKESGVNYIFGEQVASPLGRAWLARVQTDLEAVGYTFGASDLCAAGIGAPHIRQRLYWVAYYDGRRRKNGWPKNNAKNENLFSTGEGISNECTTSSQYSSINGMAHSEGAGRWANAGTVRKCSDACIRETKGEDAGWTLLQTRRPLDCGSINLFSPWNATTHILCADGKARRIESGSEPLVTGVPFRLADGRTREDASRSQVLKGIGNSIVPLLAAVFIRAFMESVGIYPIGVKAGAQDQEGQ